MVKKLAIIIIPLTIFLLILIWSGVIRTDSINIVAENKQTQLYNDKTLQKLIRNNDLIDKKINEQKNAIANNKNIIVNEDNAGTDFLKNESEILERAAEIEKKIKEALMKD